MVIENVKCLKDSQGKYAASQKQRPMWNPRIEVAGERREHHEGNRKRIERTKELLVFTVQYGGH